MTIQLDTNSMTITDSYTDIMNIDFGYVSHSFNQFVEIDNGHIITLDHGDAHPRSLVIGRYTSPVTSGKFINGATIFNYSEIYDIPDSTAAHYNFTGVAVGGFEATGTGYLTAIDSVDMGNYNPNNTRDIYVIHTPKSGGSFGNSSVKRITTDGGYNTPQLVKISDSRFILLWSKNGTVSYASLDGNGNITSSVYSLSGNLSDCEPIVSGSKIVWYAYENEDVTFYEISTSDLSQNNAVQVVAGHDYEYVGTTDGVAEFECKKCGKADTKTVATELKIFGKTDPNATVFERPIPMELGADEKLYILASTKPLNIENKEIEVIVADERVLSYNEDIKALIPTGSGVTDVTFRVKYNPEILETYTLKISHEHICSEEWAIEREATCTEEGLQIKTCTACGETLETEEIPVIDHKFGDFIIVEEATCKKVGLKQRVCEYCGLETDRTVTAKADHELETEVIEPTYEERGYTLHTCKNCDYSKKTDFVDKLTEITTAQTTEPVVITTEPIITTTVPVTTTAKATTTAPVATTAKQTTTTAPVTTTKATTTTTAPVTTTAKQTTTTTVATTEETATEEPKEYYVAFLITKGRIACWGESFIVKHGEAAPTPEIPDKYKSHFICWDTDYSCVTEHLDIRAVMDWTDSAETTTAPITTTAEQTTTTALVTTTVKQTTTTTAPVTTTTEQTTTAPVTTIEPAKVQGVTVKDCGVDSATIEWEPANYVEGYIVKEKIDGEYIQVKKLYGNGNVKYTCENLEPVSVYYFKICTYVDDVEGEAVNVTVKTLPLELEGKPVVTVDSVESKTADISWTPVKNAEKYVISFERDNGTRTTTVSGDRTSCTIYGLSPETSTIVTVTPMLSNISGESGSCVVTTTAENKTTVSWYIGDEPLVFDDDDTAEIDKTDYKVQDITGVEITWRYSNRIGFNWNELTNVEGYVIQQYINGSWVDIKITNMPMFREFNLTPSTEYRYRICSYVGTERGNYTEVTVTTTAED